MFPRWRSAHGSIRAAPETGSGRHRDRPRRHEGRQGWMPLISQLCRKGGLYRVRCPYSTGTATYRLLRGSVRSRSARRRRQHEELAALPPRRERAPAPYEEAGALVSRHEGEWVRSVALLDGVPGDRGRAGARAVAELLPLLAALGGADPGRRALLAHAVVDRLPRTRRPLRPASPRRTSRRHRAATRGSSRRRTPRRGPAGGTGRRYAPRPMATRPSLGRR